MKGWPFGISSKCDGLNRFDRYNSLKKVQTIICKSISLFSLGNTNTITGSERWYDIYKDTGYCSLLFYLHNQSILNVERFQRHLWLTPVHINKMVVWQYYETYPRSKNLLYFSSCSPTGDLYMTVHGNAGCCCERKRKRERSVQQFLQRERVKPVWRLQWLPRKDVVQDAKEWEVNE